MDLLGWLVASINVIGGTIVIRWLVRQINALKGTIAAQTETLSTIGQVNRTLLEVFTAMDPERWAKEVKIHKQLADEKASAIIEQERMKLDEERRKSAEQARTAVDNAADYFSDFVYAAMRLMTHIGREDRDAIIDSMTVKESAKRTLREASASLPDANPATRFFSALQKFQPHSTTGLGTLSDLFYTSHLPQGERSGESTEPPPKGEP